MKYRMIVVVGYPAFLLVCGGLAYYRPIYNFDLLPYAACALVMSGEAPTKIHSAVYGPVNTEIPSKYLGTLIGEDTYRADMASNPYHFMEQLPFYSTKPLYVDCILLLYRLGFSLFRAIQAISACSLVLLGVVLFLWMGSYSDLARSALCSALLLALPPVFDLGRLSTPDGISAAIVLWAFFLIFEGKAEAVGIGLLCLSTFIRPDNLILLVIVVAYLVSPLNKISRIRKAYGFIVIALGVFSVLLISFVGGHYGWKMLFYHTIVQPMNNPAEILLRVRLMDYLRIALFSIRHGLQSTSLMTFALLCVACLLFARPPQRLRHLPAIIAVSFVLKVVALPHLEDRYFVYGYLCTVICLVSGLTCGRDLPSIGQKTEPAG